MELEKIRELVEKKFDAYEIFYLKEIKRKVESRNCEIFGVEIKEEEGIAVRAINKGKLAFSYTFNLDKEGVLKLLEDLERIFPYLNEDEANGFPEWRKPEEYPELSLYDAQGQKIGMEEKAKELIMMEETIRKDKRIVATRNCELTEKSIFVKIVNSFGLSVESMKTIYLVSALAVAKDGEEISWCDHTFSHRFSDIDFSGFGEMIREKTLSFLSPIKLKTGIYSGILSPRVASDLLGVLSNSFLAENLYKEKTKLKGKVNEKVFSEAVNILSSGTLGAYSFPFDGEGSPSKEVEVVKDGYFLTFLYDSYYANKLCAKTTANCVRSGITDMPRCGIIGMYIDKGKGKIQDIGEGEILVEDLIGVHTANPITGDFSLGAVGFLKKGGSLVPFHGVIISGNIFQVFQDVREVGDDLKFYGRYGSPSLFVTSLRISGL